MFLIGPEAKEVGALSKRTAGLMSQLSTPTTRLPRSFHLLMPRSSVGSCGKGERCKRAGSPVVLYNVFDPTQGTHRPQMPPTIPTSSVITDQLTRALGQAVIRIWSNLPQEVQDHLFKEAVSSQGDHKIPTSSLPAR